ncbi:tannase and feruloyl esterase-domain-containing protein [Hypoxylon sp. FL1150]|nr:tannase and feruloyl esterase-domain-containing protein [Hypoxylon sp. FL1150]
MSSCDPSIFCPPTLEGAVVRSVYAQLVTSYSRRVTPVNYPNNDGLLVDNISFCNVTVSYTHPKKDDFVSVESWLPADNWNGRLQVAGGSGLGPGRFNMTWLDLSPKATPQAVRTLVLRTLWIPTPTIAKSVIGDFYGRPTAYSCFNGCSQGGRQSFELTQKHPTAFDGIAASAPAIHWAQWALAMFWPQMLMNVMGEYPHGCE